MLYARLFTLISSLCLGVFVTYVSFSFGQPKIEVQVEQDTIYESNLDTNTITMKPVVDPSALGTPKQEYFTELDRLSFAFFEPNKDEKINETFTYSTGQINIHNGAYIFGLYNPFVKYSLYSKNFQIEQITNGSIYFGTEDDGTISIFSLDAVVRLYFIADGKTMTDMILFPGNYLRFDPRRNAELDSVDLFRVITSLDGSNQTFEYVNPKLDGGAVLTNYRFSNKNQLIRLFHKFFQDKVGNISEIKNKYRNSNTFSAVSNSPLFMNPTKKSHFLLLSLSSELTKIVLNVNLQPDPITRRIGDIYQQSDKDNIRGPVRATLEQFVTDSRFAIYGDKVNANFDTIYFNIASLINITPTSKRSKKFQDLSNIYAKNIVASTSTKGLSRADVYAATSNILMNILTAQDELTSKDFFDIAIYSYNILLKSEVQGRYADEFVLNMNTHRLLKTFFEASSLYYNNIKEESKKKSAVKIFAVEFYDHIFSALSQGVVETFTYRDADGYYFLRPKYKNGDDLRLNIDVGIIGSIRDHIDTAKNIVNLLTSDPSYQDDVSTNGVISRIKDSIITLQNFLKMVDEYRVYVKNPYNSLLEDRSGQVIPTTPSLIIPDSEIIPVQTTQTGTLSGAEDPLKTLQKIFPSLTSQEVTMSGENIVIIQKIPFSVSDSAGKKYDTTFSATYNTATKAMTDMVILFEKNRIAVVPSKLTFGLFNRYVPFLGDYLQKVKYLYDNGIIGTGDVRISLSDNKVYVTDVGYPIREE